MSINELCLMCKKEIPYEKRRNKFCNHSCSASYNNQGVARNGKKRKCDECGKFMSNKQFCSRSCFRINVWKKIFKLIEENGSLLHTNDKIYGYNPTISKKYLAEKRGLKCEICNGVEWFGNPIPLVLDHINGDPENHKLTNVRLVCGNCNMLLPTFCGRNRGKGRSSRYDGI